MKNFSAKNAEFETLKINNEAAITSANLGTDPNKIPLNKDLGSLAYQDAVNLDDVSADMLELRAIATEISDSAVDVFVYDTSRDSDGGAWRKRTQHTSWYNEELNTATRGARKEFPCVAVIVAEDDTLTVYDGDDPDMPMWMIFNSSGANGVAMLGRSTESTTSVAMLNGILSVGRSSFGLHIVHFISDFAEFKEAGYDNPYALPIGTNRNSGNSWVTVNRGNDLVNDTINDVAMTVLPNAPIDADTGLPVPTIAVATGNTSNYSGSVIKDDGTVVDINSYSGNTAHAYEYVTFSDDGTIWWARDYYLNGFAYVANTTVDGVLLAEYGSTFSGRSTSSAQLITTGSTSNIPKINDISMRGFAVGQTVGLNIFDYSDTGQDNSSVAHITSSYNTGWMPGDIKLATLSDTTVENIGVNSDELLTGDNSSFNSGTGDWSGVHADLSTDAGRLKVTNNTSSDSGLVYLDVDTVVGKKYSLRVSIDIGTSLEASLRVYNGAGFTDQNTFVNKDTSGTYYLQFNAESSTSRIALQNNSTTNEQYSFFDSINLKQTTELITNGDFSAGDDGSWSVGPESTATFTNNQLTISGTTVGGPYVYQILNLIAGQTYTFEFDIDSMTADLASVYLGPSANGIYVTSAGKYSYTFVYDTSMYPHLVLLCKNGNAVFNSVSFRPAVEDRSVNNNGLQVIGKINKAPVAPGADLVAYSGFSANDYLVQPYNEDLNFGTGDFCIMFWLNLEVNDAYDGIIAKKNDWAFETGHNNSISFKVWDGTTYGDTVNTTGSGNTGDAIFGAWRCLCVNRKSNILSLFLDGIEKTDPDNPVQSDTDMTSAFGLSIGYGDGVSPAEKTLVSLLRISKTAPTAEQIAKIYRDEKVLFQDGAQATLYGTSDSVTALAYDDSEQLLHIGTASGRSDFRGLARVNNTTTAISNSISAAEGTIIQN